MHEEIKEPKDIDPEVKETEVKETEVIETEPSDETTSLATLTEKISELTKQIEKLEKMNQNLMIQQHVDDVDDSKLFSIFNRYNRKR